MNQPGPNPPDMSESQYKCEMQIEMRKMQRRGSCRGGRPNDLENRWRAGCDGGERGPHAAQCAQWRHGRTAARDPPALTERVTS